MSMRNSFLASLDGVCSSIRREVVLLPGESEKSRFERQKMMSQLSGSPCNLEGFIPENGASVYLPKLEFPLCSVPTAA